MRATHSRRREVSNMSEGVESERTPKEDMNERISSVTESTGHVTPSARESGISTKSATNTGPVSLNKSILTKGMQI